MLAFRLDHAELLAEPIDEGRDTEGQDQGGQRPDDGSALTRLLTLHVIHRFEQVERFQDDGHRPREDVVEAKRHEERMLDRRHSLEKTATGVILYRQARLPAVRDCLNGRALVGNAIEQQSQPMCRGVIRRMCCSDGRKIEHGVRIRHDAGQPGKVIEGEALGRPTAWNAIDETLEAHQRRQRHRQGRPSLGERQSNAMTRRRRFFGQGQMPTTQARGIDEDEKFHATGSSFNVYQP